VCPPRHHHRTWPRDLDLNLGGRVYIRHGVVIRAVVQHIRTRAADQPVVASLAKEMVFVVATTEIVVAIAAMEKVGAGAVRVRDREPTRA